MKKQSEIRLSKSSAWLYFWLSDDIRQTGYDSWKIETFPHKKAYAKCLRKLKSMGFKVTSNPRYQQDFKCLSKYHRYAFKDGLEIEIEISSANIKFEFFQNIVQGTRSEGDGRFESEKYKLMPYLMKKRFDHTCNVISAIFQKEYDCIIELVDKPLLSCDAIVRHCTGCHWKLRNPTSLDDIVNCVRPDEGSYSTLDKDKKPITSGEIKYFRDWKTGRLMYGRVFHNINNMWWIQIDKFRYTNMACFELFDPTPSDFEVRRLRKNTMPESKKKELDFLKSISAAKLTQLLRKVKSV